jgi:hypothetical protein
VKNRALLLAVVLLFALGAGAGWLVATGVSRGETRLPIKQSYLRRKVSRDREPAMFWVSIGVYGVLSAGALVLAVLGVRAGRRL